VAPVDAAPGGRRVASGQRGSQRLLHLLTVHTIGYQIIKVSPGLQSTKNLIVSRQTLVDRKGLARSDAPVELEEVDVRLERLD
jgi:hypothetical protein